MDNSSAVTYCEFGQDATCIRCGYVARRQKTIRECRPPQGLGDMVKSALSTIGITEERVSKAIGKPCGCSKRAAKMNAFGAKYLGLPAGRQNGQNDARNSPS